MRLLDLPVEVLSMIIEHVDFVTLLVSVRSTSRCLRHMAEDVLAQAAVKYNIVSLFHCSTALTGLPFLRMRVSEPGPDISILWLDRTEQLYADFAKEETHYDWKVSTLALQTPLDKGFTGLHPVEKLSSVDFRISTSPEICTVKFAHIALVRPSLADCTSDSLGFSLRGLLCTNATRSWRTQHLTGLLSYLGSSQTPESRPPIASDILYTKEFATNYGSGRNENHVKLIVNSLESLLPSIDLFERQASRGLDFLCAWATREMSLVEQEPDHDQWAAMSDWADDISDIHDEVQKLRNAWSTLRGTTVLSQGLDARATSKCTIPGIAQLRNPQLGKDLCQAVYDLITTVTWFCDQYPGGESSMVDFFNRTKITEETQTRGK